MNHTSPQPFDTSCPAVFVIIVFSVQESLQQYSNVLEVALPVADAEASLDHAAGTNDTPVR
jgi:hypothetical protein